MSQSMNDDDSFDRDGNLLPFQEGMVMGPHGPRAAESWEMPQRTRAIAKFDAEHADESEEATE